jgi:hypothetical protein
MSKSLIAKLENITKDDLRPQNKAMYRVLLDVIDFMDANGNLNKHVLGAKLSEELAKGLLKVIGRGDIYLENFEVGIRYKFLVDEYGFEQNFLEKYDRNCIKKLSNAGFRVFSVVTSSFLEGMICCTEYSYVPSNLARYVSPSSKGSNTHDKVVEYFYRVLSAAIEGNIAVHRVMHSDILDKFISSQSK